MNEEGGCECPHLCLRCVASLYSSATYVRIEHLPDRDLTREFGYGGKLVEACLSLVEQGHELQIDHQRNCGLKAAGILKGEAVCYSHMPYVLYP